jgi:SAM-dependent methyltransferase
MPAASTSPPALAAATPAPRLPWPLPAVLAWACGWAAWLALGAAGVAPGMAFAAAALAALALAWRCAGAWRRLIAAAGFPLSALVLGAGPGVPVWAWAAAALALALLYPLRAWRDAPFFPTPAAALDGLPEVVVPAPARVLDAGCGAGHGLAALRRLWPQAELHGTEWSRPLAAWASLARRDARVRRGDLWRQSWADFDLVYLFQRPESMARAHAKARAEMAAGGWLVSLEFAVPGVAPVACLRGAGRRPVWVYRIEAAAHARPPARSRPPRRRR